MHRLKKLSEFRNIVLFVLLATVWGTSYTVIDVGLQRLPPLLFGGLRYDLAAVLLFAVAAARGNRLRPRTRREWAVVAIGGTFLVGLHIAALFVGQRYVASATAAIVLSTTPILTPLFAWAILGTRIGVRTAIGAVFGLVGVAVVAGWQPPLAMPTVGASGLASLAVPGGETLGVLLLFAAAATFALGAVLLDRLPASLPPATAQAWMMLIGALQLHLGSPALGESAGVIDAPAVGAILYLAVVSGAFGYLAYFELLRAIGPVRVSVVNYAIPVVAAISGWALLGETLSPTALAGFGLVAVGFAAMQWDGIVSFQARLDRGYTAKNEYVPEGPSVAAHADD